MLDVLFWGLKASPVAWASFMEAFGEVNGNFWWKSKNKIFSCKFFSVLGHQSLDPDPGSRSAIRKNAGSGSVSGSETLPTSKLRRPVLYSSRIPPKLCAVSSDSHVISSFCLVWIYSLSLSSSAHFNKFSGNRFLSVAEERCTNKTRSIFTQQPVSTKQKEIKRCFFGYRYIRPRWKGANLFVQMT